MKMMSFLYFEIMSYLFLCYEGSFSFINDSIYGYFRFLKKLLWQNKKLENLSHPQILNTVFEFC